MEGKQRLQTIKFNNPNIPTPVAPYVVAKRVDHSVPLIYVSGQIGINPQTKTIPESVEEQTIQAMSNLKTILTDANSSLDNIIKAIVYLVDMSDFAKMNGEYEKFFKDGNFPTRVCIAVKALPLGAKVEVDVTAIENSK